MQYLIHSKQVGQPPQQTTDEQAPETDNAREIMKYATLRKRGVIRRRILSKKKQLLGL